MLKKIMIIMGIILLFFFLSIIVYKPKLNKIQNSFIIYDNNNEKIGEILEKNNIRHEEININDIPNFSKKVIINIEDKTFYTNIGIDFFAIVRALKSHILNEKVKEGASTISTQVIRNNYWLNEKRSFVKKIAEFYLAINLNFHYSKDKILETYLNNIYFGQLNYGLKSGAKNYFGKELNNLTQAEQIALLVIPKNPNLYSPIKNKTNFKNRFKAIIKTLEKNKVINNIEKTNIEKEKLSFKNPNQISLPYVIDYLKKQKTLTFSKINGKMSIDTTIDYNLSKKIDELAKNTIEPLRWKGVGDYGILIVDRKTSEIRVLIGGDDYTGKGGQVNSILALRQPGSTIKPFTYLLAFKNLGLTPESSIVDEPVQFFTEKGYAYTPKNYSLDYKGKISVAEALSQSINIPAVKIGNEVGVGNLLSFLKQVGITSLNKDIDYYGLALTLGVGEVNLHELLRAYSIFSNGGDLCNFNIIKNSGGKKCKKIIEEKYIEMIESILTNRYFKLAGFPINSSLDFPDRYVFVKTGTSRNFNDNWALGFSEKYLIGVWVGNKNGEEMKGVSGASGAGEIFRNIIYEIESNDYQPKSYEPRNKDENFLEITNPLNGSIYKINPSKPKEIQSLKLEFKTNIEYDSYFWKINNTIIKGNTFKLNPGIYEINLMVSKNGNMINNKKVKIKVLD